MHSEKDYSRDGILLIVKEIQFIKMYGSKYNEDGTIDAVNRISNWRFLNCHTDDNAAMFGIEIAEFRNILKKYGAQRIYINQYFPNELGFESIEDCVNFVNSEELMPYLVMKKLGD